MSEFDICGEIQESFFADRQARRVARDLIGKFLAVEEVSGSITGGLIVETEAYVSDVDPSCHLADGRTARTEPFFSGPGTVYVFKIYSHNNVNFITRYNTHPEGVLIRAVEPTHDIDQMIDRTGR